ncbi:MAG: hypothetical protein ACXWQO_03925 [Bdellovibrionota bacterium]
MKALLIILALLPFSNLARADGVSCEAYAHSSIFGNTGMRYGNCHSCRENNRGDRNIDCVQSCSRTTFECSVSKFDVNSGGTSFTARGESQAVAESQARALCEMSVAGSTTSFCIASASCQAVEESLGEQSCR